MFTNYHAYKDKPDVRTNSVRYKGAVLNLDVRMSMVINIDHSSVYFGEIMALGFVQKWMSDNGYARTVINHSETSVYEVGNKTDVERVQILKDCCQAWKNELTSMLPFAEESFNGDD